MNSVHDIGGTDGFGPVRPELNEPVFHEPWEGRVLGMLITGAGYPPTPIDAGRHRLERLDPVRYLASSYYERHLAAMENAIVEAGTLTREEIEAKIQQFTADPSLAIPRREDPALAEGIPSILRTGQPVTRQIRCWQEAGVTVASINVQVKTELVVLTYSTRADFDRFSENCENWRD